MRVLFVCLGNICRSAAAEGVARARFPDWRVDSAGTGGWHVGHPPHPPMIAAAGTRGLDLSDQQARQVTSADFGRFDRVLAMDRAVLRDLRAMSGSAAAELFLDAAGMGARDVPDPYYTRDFEGCIDLIEAGVARLG